MKKQYIIYRYPDWENPIVLEQDDDLDLYLSGDEDTGLITVERIEMTEEEFNKMLEWEG